MRHVILDTFGAYGADYTDPRSFYMPAQPADSVPNYVMQSSGNPPANSSPPTAVPIGTAAGSVSWADVGASFLKGVGTGISDVFGPKKDQLTPEQIAAIQAAQTKQDSGIPKWVMYAVPAVVVLGVAAFVVARPRKSAAAMSGYKRKIKRGKR